MLLAGAWLAFLGYWVMYTGVAKLSGDTTCTLGKSIRGQCSPGTAGSGHGGPAPGVTSREAADAHKALQFYTLPGKPLEAAAA